MDRLKYTVPVPDSTGLVQLSPPPHGKPRAEGRTWTRLRIPKDSKVAHAAEFSKTAAPFERGFRSSDAHMRKLSLTRGPGSIALTPQPPKAALAHLQHAAVQPLGGYVQLVAGQRLAVELHAALSQQPASLGG